MVSEAKESQSHQSKSIGGGKRGGGGGGGEGVEEGGLSPGSHASLAFCVSAGAGWLAGRADFNSSFASN